MMTCLIAPFITTARKDLRDLIVYIKLFDNFEEKKTLGGGDETQGGTELLRLYGTAVSFLSVLFSVYVFSADWLRLHLESSAHSPVYLQKVRQVSGTF